MLRRAVSQLVRTRACTSKFPARLRTLQSHKAPQQVQPSYSTARAFSVSCTRHSDSGKSSVDEKMEEIQELYAAAKDEFEIAAEETEAHTIYAEDDRVAARDALGELQKAYNEAIGDADPQFREEVKKRVGPRIRELENAVTAMEEMAQNHD